MLFKMGFELQDSANHITIKRKSIPSRGNTGTKALKRELGKFVEQKETQCGWGIVTNEEIS